MREAVGRGTVKGLWEIFSELIMWKDTARSTLWFGLGSLFFVSSSFSRECGFSVISAASHLGILVLALAFFYDSVPQRQQLTWRGNFQLTEEDIVRVARVVLPVANEVLSKSREIFSGEPSMTLKVAPILLFTAKYGHLMTPWRLFATGFFLSFTAPKLYSSYAQQIHERVEAVRNYVSETWKSCQHKKLIAASAATVIWNLLSAKTRIVAAFMSVVVLRYHRQRLVQKGSSMEEGEEEQQQQAMVIVE